MKRSKYYIRVMRPIFQRAIFTVEATSGEEALRSAQEQVELLPEREWARLEAEQEPPVVEIALQDDVTEGAAEAEVLESVSDVSMLTPSCRPTLSLAKALSLRPPG